MNTALLLIDIQKDYFPDGAMELEGSIEASLAARKILEFFRERDMPLVHIQHVSVRPGATFLLPNTPGMAIHENVLPLPDETVVQKHYPNGFRDTPLLPHLRKQRISHVVLAGMMTHMCVEATTRAAFDHGLQCTVVHDACATKSLSFGSTTVPAAAVHAAALAALGAVYAKVISAEGLLSNLGSWVRVKVERQ